MCCPAKCCEEVLKIIDSGTEEDQISVLTIPLASYVTLARLYNWYLSGALFLYVDFLTGCGYSQVENVGKNRSKALGIW